MHRASLADQRVVRAPLAEIAAAAARAGVGAPAVVVIGDVVDVLTARLSRKLSYPCRMLVQTVAGFERTV